MIDLALLAIFSYALYRLAEGNHIYPWKWIIRYVVTFITSTVVACCIVIGWYGSAIVKDTAAMEKLSLSIEPFILLYQFVLFFFFRTRIVRYVHLLDQIDKANDSNNNHTPDSPRPPRPPQKDQKDFSYFR